MYMYCL